MFTLISSLLLASVVSNDAVVAVHGHEEGSGFVAKATDANYYIVTASHVVDLAKSGTISVSFSGQSRKWTASLIGNEPDDTRGLAILKVKRTDSVPEIRKIVEVDDTVLVGSGPFTAYGAAGVKQASLAESRGKYLFLSLGLEPGYSGGPVLSRYGTLVGVTMLSEQGEAGQPLRSTIVPTAVLQGVLHQLAPTIFPDPGGGYLPSVRRLLSVGNKKGFGETADLYDFARGVRIVFGADLLALSSLPEGLAPDISPTSPEYNVIKRLVGLKALPQYPDELLRPSRPLTGYQTAAAISDVLRAISKSPPLSSQGFPDVPTNHWANAYVRQLLRARIMAGYDDGLFRGGVPLTMYDLTTVFARAKMYVDEH